MTVRAKFQCQSITTYNGGQTTVKLQAVNKSDTDNIDWSAYTPSGSIELSISPGKPAIDEFIPGQAYFIDFTKAD